MCVDIRCARVRGCRAAAAAAARDVLCSVEAAHGTASQAASEALPGTVVARGGDVTDEAAVVAALDDCTARFGRVGGMFANAGVSVRAVMRRERVSVSGAEC